MDAQGELLITIMSSIAQQESDSISKNVRRGIQYQFQQGRPRLNTAQFLGLTRDPETKTLVIIPEEADLVRVNHHLNTPKREVLWRSAFTEELRDRFPDT